jgi:RimJ/RimL family protein N-acetyltransferase
MIEGLVLFLGLCFRNWNLRKLYAEIPGFNWAQFESVTDYFLRVEGLLPDHEYFDGRFWDHRIVAVYREDFEQEVGPEGRWLQLFG